jgi:hypothetical protein
MGLCIAADTSFSALLLGPSLSQEVKSDDLDAMVCDVATVIAHLTTGKLHHLQLVRSSPAYVKRLVETLVRSRAARFFLGAMYQNGGKYTQ